MIIIDVALANFYLLKDNNKNIKKRCEKYAQNEVNDKQCTKTPDYVMIVISTQKNLIMLKMNVIR